MEKTGLVLIDIQKDYFKGGKCELFQPEAAAKQAKRLLTYFRENNLPVFHVQHISQRSDAGFFIPGTEGVKIFDDVLPIGDEPIIIKHFPDSFFQTNLKELLDSHSVNQLVVCGMMTHMCIDTTVRAAKNFGYQVTLIEDACTTKDLSWKDSIIQAPVVQNTFMTSLNGRFASILSAAQWIEG